MISPDVFFTERTRNLLGALILASPSGSRQEINAAIAVIYEAIQKHKIPNGPLTVALVTMTKRMLQKYEEDIGHVIPKANKVI